jgi:hypothetical protein
MQPPYRTGAPGGRGAARPPIRPRAPLRDRAITAAILVVTVVLAYVALGLAPAPG